MGDETMVSCLILAAGEGKRMRPLTGSRPKVMLPVATRPMMEHLISVVRDAGITSIILVVGYHEEAVRNHFKDGSDLGVRISYIRQKEQLGTGDAVCTAESKINERFLLLNGDMLLKKEDVSALLVCNTPCMAVHSSEHPEDYGVVTITDGIISSLTEKSKHPGSNLINAGMYLLDTDIFTYLKEIVPSSRGEIELTDALMRYIREGTLRSFQLSYWYDMGNPWDLLLANEELLSDMVPEQKGAIIEQGNTIKGSVSIGEGTVIKTGTYIEGPCIIGKDCKIGPHAYIRGSTSIGDGCHIGHATEVKNSIIMNNTNIPHFNYVGDSIIGSRCNLGAGTKIANLRHDKMTIHVAGTDTRRKKFGAIIGDNVLTGINCSVNVGTVIGNNCVFAPHSYIDGTIQNNTVIRR